MLDNNELGLTLYRNPNLIQSKVLEEHQNRLEGKVNIVDPNNTFNFLLEATSTMTADSILRVENALAPVYPKRAQTSEDLYKHMSDYDYVGVYSLPADLSLQILLDRAYLIKHAKKVNNNHNKVIIPKNTIFNIGKYQFGLYYPIEIQISRSTDSITVVYDTSTINPLYTLKDNTITKREYTYKSLSILSITVPVYQFSRSTILEDITPALGFVKKYRYNDKFYAARIWTTKDGESIELGYTLSDTVYDPYVPTAKLSIFEETQEVKISVPQVYFSNGLMGNKLEIELYTTKGYLDVDISEINDSAKNANFALTHKDTTEYSTILNNIPTILLQPVTDKLIGGSNGYTYEQLRQYIIDDTLHESVLVTPIELENHFAKKNIEIVKYKDNLTERIYFGYVPIKDSDDTLISVTNTYIKISEVNTSDVSTIITNVDGSITILPTTLYKYNSNSDICVPLTDSEKTALLSKPKRELAEALNEQTYTQNPFHIRLISDEKYPRAESFDMTPDTYNLTFVEDNPTLSAQLVAVAAKLIHLDNTTGGYELRLGIDKSRDLTTLPEEDIVVYLQIQTGTGTYIGGRCTYVGDSNGTSIYKLPIQTNYHINEQHRLSVTNLETTQGVVQTHYIELESDIHLTTLVKKNHFPNAQQVDTMYANLPTNQYSEYLCSSKQKMTCIFGSNLSNTILNNVDINWTAQDYVTYEDVVYFTYPEDVYEVDETGALVYTLDENDQIVLNKLHTAGDIVYDENSLPKIKHHIGDIMRDVDGNPIVSDTRMIEYYIDNIQFDYKPFKTDTTNVNSYRSELVGAIKSYLDEIATSSTQLLERTDLYFKPYQTLGIGKFNVGNGRTVTMPLDLSFDIRFYVPTYVYTDPQILNLISQVTESNIEKVLSEKIISMTKISELIMTDLSGYIDTIDIGGINDDINLQTLIVADQSIRPSIKRILEYDNNSLSLKKDINISFIKSE
jgi:hypothetical protein